MNEGLYVDTRRLVTALLEGENVKARELMKSFPKAAFPDLLHIIAHVTTAMDESREEEDFLFHKEVSKSLMILACEHPELEDVWNAAMHDDVSIHFDNFKPFITACQSGNLCMVKDFRRFQYDEEDGSKMIPDYVWAKGANVAKKEGENDVYNWITKYLESGTDDEDDVSSSESCDYDYSCGHCPEACAEEGHCHNGDEEDVEDDEDDEDMIYEKTRERLKEQRARMRAQNK